MSLLTISFHLNRVLVYSIDASQMVVSVYCCCMRGMVMPWLDVVSRTSFVLCPCDESQLYVGSAICNISRNTRCYSSPYIPCFTSHKRVSRNVDQFNISYDLNYRSCTLSIASQLYYFRCFSLLTFMPLQSPFPRNDPTDCDRSD